MKKGLTLIELLIVIAIIGILFSIIMVTIEGNNKGAKKSDYETCQGYRLNKIENQPAFCLKFYLEEIQALKK